MLSVYLIFQGVLTFVYISLLSTVGERLAARMRHNLFRSIIIQDITFFDTKKTGEIVNRLVRVLLLLEISEAMLSFRSTLNS